MVSAQEYFEMVEAHRKLIFYSQLEKCEFALYSSAKYLGTGSDTGDTGHFEVELEEYPLQELTSELTRLGYTNIEFSTEKCYSYGMLGVLSFDVPQLTEKQASASDKDTL